MMFFCPYFRHRYPSSCACALCGVGRSSGSGASFSASALDRDRSFVVMMFDRCKISPPAVNDVRGRLASVVHGVTPSRRRRRLDLLAFVVPHRVSIRRRRRRRRRHRRRHRRRALPTVDPSSPLRVARDIHRERPSPLAARPIALSPRAPRVRRPRTSDHRARDDPERPTAARARWKNWQTNRRRRRGDGAHHP